MLYKVQRDEASMRTLVSLEIYDHDLARADYEPHDKALLTALECQQTTDPTAEGLLMILQIHARAIERARC